MTLGNVYLGQIVTTNMRRKVESVRFVVVSVPFSELLQQGVTWDVYHVAGADRRSWESIEAARDAAERLMGRGLDAAVAVLACGDGPAESWAADPDRGPATAVVMELITDARLVEPTALPEFPGRQRLIDVLEELYPNPATVVEESNRDE